MARTFADRLREVISETPFSRWASDHGFTPSTVEEWLNKNRTPRDASLGKLVIATGIPEEWWLQGDGPPPNIPELKVMKGFAALSERKPDPHHVDQDRAGYVAVPLYTDVRAAAGSGSLVEHEAADDALIFKEDWIRFALGARPQDLYLIRVAGDSMEPTLRSEDVILVDRRATRPDREGVYILRMNGMLLVKRLQALPGGLVRVMSDNPTFAPYEVALTDLDGDKMAVIGRVIWTGRRL